MIPRAGALKLSVPILRPSVFAAAKPVRALRSVLGTTASPRGCRFVMTQAEAEAVTCMAATYSPSSGGGVGTQGRAIGMRVRVNTWGPQKTGS